MVKNKVILFLVCFLCCSFPVCVGQTCIETTLDRQLGTRESGGNNRGWRVAQYLKSVGLPEGNPWCAAYVHWALDKCGVPNSITGWSPTAHNKNNIVFFKREFKKNPSTGDVFTIYSMSKKRIAHTGFLRERLNDKFYLTNEGNAAPDGYHSPYDGFGVFEKIRSFNATYSITRWE
jgi:hypothetical protein